MRGLRLVQDGIPINMADDNGDFQELDPQVFQHLEVYRGGNALRLGGSTLGGAINSVTPTGLSAPGAEIGRAAGRGRVCPCVKISVVAVSLKNKKNERMKKTLKRTQNEKSTT